MLEPKPKTEARVRATRFGIVVALGNSGDDIGDDLAEAIYLAGGGDLCPHTPEQLAACIEYEQITRGLQAEAGYSGAFILILHGHSEQMANGMRIGRWLTFSETAVGDAVYWNVGVVHGPGNPVCFADLAAANAVLDMLRALGGAPTATYDDVCEVPDPDELAELRSH